MPLLWVLVGFFAGSVPFGVLVARSRRVDLTQTGSGNIGAANVARTLGKRLGLMVLSLDAAKGAIPVALTRGVAIGAGHGAMADPRLALSVAGAAVLGHCFTPWLRFRGGKGVATSLGVLLVLEPAAVGCAALVFLLAYAAKRIVSVGSLAAALSLPPILLALRRPAEVVGFSVALLLLLLVLHRDNLRRLRLGTEARFG